jgi:hypothetical protein
MIQIVALLLFFAIATHAQTAQPAASAPTATTSHIGMGYQGYNRTSFGDPLAATYDTSSTPANVSVKFPPPDVFLNASVHVGEIYVDVENITAKINLSAKVLNLLNFNAGVDASIDRVALTITDVNARVLLEARLGNIVMMINDVLHSIDLNPIIARLGKDVSHIANTTTHAVGGIVNGLGNNKGGGQMVKRELDPDYDIEHNILYTINNYSGHVHTIRVLLKNGNIVERILDDHGHIEGEKLIGSYDRDMRFNGHNITTTRKGRTVRELEYIYEPFYGFDVISMITQDQAGTVIDARIISEMSAGGGSSINENP